MCSAVKQQKSLDDLISAPLSSMVISPASTTRDGARVAGSSSLQHSLTAGSGDPNVMEVSN